MYYFKISQRTQLRSGVLLSYAQMGLSIIISLLYTPFMLHILGDSEYGLLQTALSTVSMLSILNLGFNSSYIRYYVGYRQKGDDLGVYRLNGLFLLLFCGLGTLVLLCGAFLAFHLEIVFKSGLTEEEYVLAKTLILIATTNMAVGFPRSVFTNIISAHERFIFMKAVAILDTIVAPLANIPLLLLGFRSRMILTVSLLVSLCSFFLYVVYVFRVLRQRFLFGSLERGLMSSLCRFTGFILINMIVDQINNQVDKVLLARFCGTAAVTLYAVGGSFQAYFTNFSTSISGIFTPHVHKLVQSTSSDPAEQRKVLTAFFTRVGRLQFLLLALIASGFVFFGQAFLNLWVGPGYEASYWVAVICVVPSLVPLTQNVGIEIQRAENLHHYRSIIYGFVAVFNLLSSIILCQLWGPVGAALGTGAACIIGNSIIMDIVYHKKINIDMIFFWKNILGQLRGMLIPFVLGALGLRFLSPSSWGELCFWILLYTGIYALFVWRFSMNQEERDTMQLAVHKILRR